MCSQRIIVCFVVLLCAVISSYGEPSKTFRDDYTYMERTRSFYKFHGEFLNWQAAIEECKSEGATLYVPQDQAEASELINKAHKDFLLVRVPSVWIGASNLKSNDVYETIDGRPLNEVFNKWASGFPNNTEVDRNCVYMPKSFTMKNYSCNYTFRFICKYSP